MKHSYTKEQFETAVKSSVSIREVLTKLGIKAIGGNYRVFRKYIKLYSIDISHFSGRAWNKGKQFEPKLPIENYLNNSKSIGSYRLKKKLIKLDFFESKCSKCLNETWLEKPIPLELEHINGNPLDNRLENLCLLCPNCHAQTPTYRGKNKRRPLTPSS